jgi:alpha-D-ribose 1-methylphosphonate 5-triphosphate synthase subunit PhnL
VNVARACLAAPRLLLVDEPTASLDPDTKRDVIELLRDLKREQVTIVATLHDPEVVAQLADDEVRMEAGNAWPATF